MLIMSAIELNHDNCVDLLRRYVDIGYKTGCAPISDGATLHRFFRILKKQDEQDPNLKEEDLLKIIMKSLELFNSKGAFCLDDAAVIDRVMKFFTEDSKKSDEEM